MSAPDKSLKKQRRRHWAPLTGMAVAILVASGLLIWWLGRDLVTEPTTPEGEAAPAQVEGPDGTAAPTGAVPQQGGVTQTETQGIPAEGDVVAPMQEGTGSPQVIEEGGPTPAPSPASPQTGGSPPANEPVPN